MARTSVLICLTVLACLLYSMKEVTQLQSQLLLNGCSEVRRTLVFTLPPFSLHFWGAVYKNWGTVSTNQLIPPLLPDLSKFNLWPGRPILTLGQLWGAPDFPCAARENIPREVAWQDRVLERWPLICPGLPLIFSATLCWPPWVNPLRHHRLEELFSLRRNTFTIIQLSFNTCKHFSETRKTRA